jgi:hypothetical protein
MDGQPFNCEGLRRALEEQVSVVEVDDEVDGEIEAHEADEWMQLEEQQKIRKDTVHKASKGVTERTDKEYERYVYSLVLGLSAALLTSHKDLSCSSLNGWSTTDIYVHLMRLSSPILHQTHLIISACGFWKSP